MSNQIEDEQALEAAVRAGTFLLFKHSPICPISTAAFERYERFLADHAEVASGWLHVIRQRPISQAVAAATGVKHESPQALVYRDGAVTWHASHDAITESSLADALAAAEEA